MRVDIPSEYEPAAPAYLRKKYAREIVDAAYKLSFATYQHSKLTLREFEAARVRIAEINGCYLCQDWRSARDLPDYLRHLDGDLSESVAARGPAPDEDFYESVLEGRDSPAFSTRERLCIEYADRMALDPHGLAVDEDLWARVKAEFSDDEIVDLTFCIGGWITNGRAMHVLGLDGACRVP